MLAVPTNAAYHATELALMVIVIATIVVIGRMIVAVQRTDNNSSGSQTWFVTLAALSKVPSLASLLEYCGKESFQTLSPLTPVSPLTAASPVTPASRVTCVTGASVSMVRYPSTNCAKCIETEEAKMSTESKVSVPTIFTVGSCVVALLAVFISLGSGWQTVQGHETRLLQVEKDNREITKTLGEINGNIRVLLERTRPGTGTTER